MSAVPRVDAELVRRGLARSRGQAGELVRAGRVTVDGQPARKPAMTVLADAAIGVQAASGDGDVGRGAAKLRSALDQLGADPATAPGPRIEGCRAVDVGAGTGGFTQVLLERGARQVVAVDVGHGQLATSLAGDPRVEDRPGTNVRTVTAADLGGPFDLLVADLSFISLTIVLPRLADLVGSGADLLLLVKPQFEVGRSRLGKAGVVRDDALRRETVTSVRAAAQRAGLTVRAVVESGVPGTSGNVEFFLWARPAGARSGA